MKTVVCCDPNVVYLHSQVEGRRTYWGTYDPLTYGV